MSALGTFVWQIADQLRGVYKPHQYGDVILPMTVLRRLDCMLEGTHEAVQRVVAAHSENGRRSALIRKETGLSFFNTSPWTFVKLVQDPDGLAANLNTASHGRMADLYFERTDVQLELRRLLGELVHETIAGDARA